MQIAGHRISPDSQYLMTQITLTRAWSLSLIARIVTIEMRAGRERAGGGLQMDTGFLSSRRERATSNKSLAANKPTELR